MTLKRISTVLILLCALAVIAAGAAYLYIQDFYQSPGPLTAESTVRIHTGERSKVIAYRLAGDNVIANPELFYVLLRLTKSDRKLQAGEYLFHPGVTPKKVIDTLVSGDVVVHQITVPEGWMTSQIIQLVDENELLAGEVPKGVKEGELLPETYDIRWGDTKEDVIRRMQKAMKDTLEQAWEQRVDNLPFSTPEEALVLASVIEKETAVPEERRRISGVFFNRLRKQMRLQTDPTVIYAITEGKYILDRPLSKKDLTIDSPYNTYIYAGLPPAPIANPGREAIFAAVSPMMTKELYFVADGTGGHAFSDTLNEHIRNVRKWRKIEKNAARQP